jgi:hypothetical protein
MVILATYADGDGMNCFPSVDTLMSDVGTDRRAVQRDLRGLEKDGYIACVVNEKGRGKTKGYLLKIQAGKGRQIPLDMGGTNTTIYKDEKGGKTAPHGDPQRAVKSSIKGGKTTSPIRSTSITSKNIEPLPGEPAGNLPCSGTENLPEDLPSISFAHRVTEELCLPREPGLLEAIASAIDFCVKFEGKTKSSATEYLIARARDEIDHGGSPTRFWFTDRKWRNGNGNGYTSRQLEKRTRNREALVSLTLGDRIHGNHGHDRGAVRNGVVAEVERTNGSDPPGSRVEGNPERPFAGTDARRGGPVHGVGARKF